MNMEIGTKAAQFPEKEFINGIFFAVQQATSRWTEARLYTEPKIYY
jgi:hypothetical protein